MPPDPTLASLQQALDALQRGEFDTAAFCRRVRALPLPPGLPPAYAEALAGLLDRLESSALFDGESCSFSQGDLLAGVQLWLAKAGERLASEGGGARVA